MKFFVMLAVLLLRNLPGQGLTRPLDRLFVQWQGLLTSWLEQSGGSARVFLLSVLPPVVVLWMLLWWLDGIFWHLPVLAVHLLVVFYALGRRNDLIWVERYLVAWRQGDQQAASYYAAEILDEPVQDTKGSDLHCRVMSRLVFFAFDRLFLALFWYLLLGPVGALLARLSERAIANARRGLRAESTEELLLPASDPGACDESVERFQRLLEWPAARLMGLTLAVTGRPLLGLRQFFADLVRWRMSSEAFLNRQLVSGYGFLSQEGATAEVYCQRPELMTEEADAEMMALRDRVWRSLALWVALSALGVIFFS